MVHYTPSGEAESSCASTPATGKNYGPCAETVAKSLARMPTTLYLRWSNGAVALVECSPKEYIEAGRFTLSEPRDSIGGTLPVVAGGHLYVRDNDRLYCFDVRQHPAELCRASRRSSSGLGHGTDLEPHMPGEPFANAIYVPTPQDVVEKMLAAAHIGKDDVVYDLGSGDGRIVIEAAKKYHCKAIGLEIDRDLVTLSRERIRSPISRSWSSSGTRTSSPRISVTPQSSPFISIPIAQAADAQVRKA